MSMFQPAQRRKTYLKLALMGPSGSGKSMSSLRLMRGLVGPEGRIAAIDTENGSITLYDHVTGFDVVTLDPPFTPEKYVEIIQAAQAEGYDGLIIDSLSHAWKSILDSKNAADARGGNSFANWRQPKERFDALKAAILQSKIHIAACLRAKTEYLQNERGKVEKAGMAAIGEPDLEYEFTAVFDIGPDHKALAGSQGRGKDRTELFGDKSGAFLITEATGEELRTWMEGGGGELAKFEPVGPTKERIKAIAKSLVPGKDEGAAYRALCKEHGFDPNAVLLDADSDGILDYDQLIGYVREMAGAKSE